MSTIGCVSVTPRACFGGAGAVLRGPMALCTAGLWAVMALSADFFPLCYALSCILSTYRPEPLSEESLPPKRPAR
eukprot:1235003-Prymnesium_polylepis.1